MQKRAIGPRVSYRNWNKTFWQQVRGIFRHKSFIYEEMHFVFLFKCFVGRNKSNFVNCTCIFFLFFALFMKTKLLHISFQMFLYLYLCIYKLHMCYFLCFECILPYPKLHVFLWLVTYFADLAWKLLNSMFWLAFLSKNLSCIFLVEFKAFVL